LGHQIYDSGTEDDHIGNKRTDGFEYHSSQHTQISWRECRRLFP